MVYQALVVGSGPGGLATVASLLDHGLTDIAWADEQWCGGRLNGMYREISSNTKVGIYLDAITSSPTCKGIIDAAARPNPVTRLEEIERDETVQLNMAGDLIMFLIDGLLNLGRVKRVDDRVQEVTYDNTVSSGRPHAFGRYSVGDVTISNLQTEEWTATLRSGSAISAKQVHLCTGSYPIVASFHERYNPSLKVLELDEVLRKSRIPALLDLKPNSRNTTTATTSEVAPRITVGVIGNSHSGVLAIRNLYEVSHEHHLPLEVLSFERRPILYAEYRDDGIVHDNTGLKGATADWSRDVMEGANPGEGHIKRIHLGRSENEEKKVYDEWLPQCTHLVYAIGYSRAPTPRIRVDGEDVTDEVQFDMHSSGFSRRLGASQPTQSGGGGGEGQPEERVPRLFGCGIAFPEEVEDPEGNVEAAVGVAKFYKFAERVGPLWVK